MGHYKIYYGSIGFVTNHPFVANNKSIRRDPLPYYQPRKIKDCLVKVEGDCWGNVQQEHSNKVERQSVKDGYKTGHGVWSRMLGSK